MEGKKIEIDNMPLHLEILTKELASKNGFKTPKICATRLGVGLYSVLINESEQESLVLLAKINNISDETNTSVAETNWCRNESIAYNTIATIFDRLQDEHNIPNERRLQFPKYYNFQSKSENEITIIEDSSLKDHIVFDGEKENNWEYAKKSLNELAKFHALGFTLKCEKLEEFNKIVDLLRPIKENATKKGNECVDNHILKITHDVIDEENQQRIQIYFEKNSFDPNFTKYKIPTKKSVIVHGDYRAENILVKYQGNSIISLKAINNNTTYYGCPIIDVIHFLFSSFNEQFRHEYFDIFFHQYYESLGAYLALLSHKIDIIYPKASFYFDLKENLIYGLELGLLSLYNIIIAESIYIMGEENCDSVAEERKISIPNEMDKEKLNGIIRDFIKWGFLDSENEDYFLKTLKENIDINNSETFVEELIETIAIQEDYLNWEFNIQSLSSLGASFMGDLFVVNVTEKDKQTLNLFVKACNASMETRNFIKIRESYENEVFVYKTVAVAFNGLQKKFCVPESKRFKFPKFYGYNMNHFEEIIVLENLTTQGYEIRERFQVLDWEFAEKCLNKIAQFHSLSFALKIHMPKIFKSIKKRIKNVLAENMQKVADLTNKNVEAYTSSIVKQENLDLWTKFIKENRLNFMRTQFKVRSRHGVIIHGDYRASNIFVKHEDGKIKSVLPIDYQTVYFGNPVQDIIYLLFTGSDEKFRNEYFDKYLEHYYNSLAMHLKSLAVDIDEVYTKSAFYFDVKERLLLSGLDTALFVLNIVLLEPGQDMQVNDMVDGDAMEDVFAKSKPNKVYEERFNGIVTDFVKWGLLK